MSSVNLNGHAMKLEELQEAMRNSKTGRRGPSWEDRQWKGGETAKQMIYRLAQEGKSKEEVLEEMDRTKKWTHGSVRSRVNLYWGGAVEHAKVVSSLEAPVEVIEAVTESVEVCSNPPASDISSLHAARDFVKTCGSIAQARGLLNTLESLQL